MSPWPSTWLNRWLISNFKTLLYISPKHRYISIKVYTDIFHSIIVKRKGLLLRGYIIGWINTYFTQNNANPHRQINSKRFERKGPKCRPTYKLIMYQMNMCRIFIAYKLWNVDLKFMWQHLDLKKMTFLFCIILHIFDFFKNNIVAYDWI